MDTKLTILFLLITTVVALSSFGEAAAERARQQIRSNRRR